MKIKLPFHTVCSRDPSHIIKLINVIKSFNAQDIAVGHFSENQHEVMMIPTNTFL